MKLPATPYSAIRKTRRNRARELDEFSSYLINFHSLQLHTTIFSDIHLLARKLESLRTRKLNELRSFLSCTEVITPTIRSCASEFLIFYWELQTAGYNGAARTLRCILETAVEACAFQTEEDRPTQRMLIKQFEDRAMLLKKRKGYLPFFMEPSALISFVERYRIYEKASRIAPTFRELINDLNSRQLFKECPEICDELKNVYVQLSDYVHPSSMKFEKAMGDSSIDVPQFESKEFDTILLLGLKVLDLVQFLYLKSLTSYFGFKTTEEYLKNLARHMVIEPENEKWFLALPFSKKLSEKIIWRILRSAKKH
jgi:hypothetical protein